MALAYLSLGANLGERERALGEALRRLENEGVRVRRVSSVYETEPVDVPDQPPFLNLVAEVETGMGAAELLAWALRIEAEMGRRREVVKGPRAIDIDLLLYGSEVIETAELVVPHPRMAERRFVLEPLAELAPDLRHPVLGRTVLELLAETTEQKVNKLEEPGWRIVSC